MALNISSLRWESGVSLGKSLMLLSFKSFCLRERVAPLLWVVSRSEWI